MQIYRQYLIPQNYFPPLFGIFRRASRSINKVDLQSANFARKAKPKEKKTADGATQPKAQRI